MKDYLCEAEDFQRYFEKASEQVCRKYGITVIGLQILTFLGDNPERNTAKDICSCRCIKNSIASMTIDKLVNRGYIIRESDAKDRRIQRLKLTGEADPIVNENQTDELREQFYEKTGEPPKKVHGECEEECSLMDQVNDLMIMGYQANLSFERDFVAEGVEMLNRFELPDEIAGLTEVHTA